MREELEARINIMQNSPKYTNVFVEMDWNEKASINLYTEKLSHPINSYLRGYVSPGTEKLAQLQMFSGHISSGLIKTTNKYTQIAYRGIALSLEDIDELNEAFDNQASFIFKAFSSATDDEPCAFDFAMKAAYQKHKYPVLLSIQSKYGVDISDLSIYNDEKEILFNKGLVVRVKSIEEEKGVWYIDLIEV